MTVEPTTPVTPPAGDPGHAPPAPAATTTPSEPQAGDEPITLDEARKLRREAQSLRQRLKTFEDAEQQARDAQLSEVERFKKQQADLQEQQEALAAELFEARVHQEVARQAGKFAFLIPAEMLARLLLADDDAIEFEDGRPANIEKLLEKLAKAAPELVRQQATPATPGQATPLTPALPAMNPGRSSIASPGQVPGRIPRLEDIQWKR